MRARAFLIVAMTSGALTQAGSANAAPVAALPEKLTVWAMFAQADWVVKAVMIGLVLASVATWSVLFAKHLELGKARKAAQDARDHFAGTNSLAGISEAYRQHDLVREVRAEIEQSIGSFEDREGLKERLVSRFDRYEARRARKMTQGVTILGTIGATAPFVGLFGTVWGIMNSFIGIAEEQTTNLAVVAPGIAEALLATALGLVAAIPAVVIYNHFARSIAAHRAVIADSSAALLRIVSRDLSRGTLETDKV